MSLPVKRRDCRYSVHDHKSGKWVKVNSAYAVVRNSDLDELEACLLNAQRTVQAFRAALEEMTKDRDNQRALWNAAESEMWTGELREQLATVTAQRDRAMELIRETASAHKDVDNYEYNGCDSIKCEYCMQYEILRDEIAKEKEAK
jgi:hypothetical protein